MGETVNGLPVAVLVGLVGGALVVAAWLVLRFGKIIGGALLILGILVVAVLGASALAGQSAANYQTARAATEAAKAASVGQSLTGLLLVAALGGMGTLTLAAVGTAGYFAVRYKLSERNNLRLGSGQRRRLPEAAQPGAVIYITDEADDEFDLAGADFAGWGWGDE